MIKKGSKAKDLLPQSGKTDVIESILLEKRYRKPSDDKPTAMLKKLTTISERTSCPNIKERAERTAKILSKYPGEIPLEEKERRNILKKVPDALATPSVIYTLENSIAK